MLKNNIIGISIYRCSEDKHYMECQNALNKNVSSAGYSLPENTISHLKSLTYSPWEYNEIIGYLKIYTQGFDLVISEHIDKHKRKRRNQKRDFISNNSSALRIRINRDESSEQIYQKLLSEIRDYGKSKRLKKRYIDTTELENIGPYVNWRSIMDSQFSNYDSSEVSDNLPEL